MEPIHVPGPSAQAFNKSRPASDLIRAQVAHLKHLEEKMPADLRRQIPQHRIVSEDDAARYIAPMTTLLRGLPIAAATPAAVPIRSIRPIAPARPAKGLAIAAAGESKSTPKAKRSPATKPASKSGKAKSIKRKNS